MWRVLTSRFISSAAPPLTLGTVFDLTTHIQRLLDAPVGSSLIVEVSDRDDAFLQFTADPQAIQIDHPLITAAQREREGALRTALAAAGLTPYETPRLDGSRFLDCDVPRDAAGAAILLERVFETVFAIDPSTELRFIGNGLPPAA